MCTAAALCVRLQVGVVSDYDLLALDQLGQTKNDKQLFPQADETWQVRGVHSTRWVPHGGPAAGVALVRSAVPHCRLTLIATDRCTPSPPRKLSGPAVA